MLESLVVLFASVAFLINAGIAIAALRVILDPKASDAVRLPALNLVAFEQRFLAWIFVFGLFGLAVKGGILPSIPIPTFWESSSAEQPDVQLNRLPRSAISTVLKPKMVISGKEIVSPISPFPFGGRALPQATYRGGSQGQMSRTQTR